MANPDFTASISSSTTSSDQRKAVAAKLLQVAHLKMVAASICDRQVKQEKGTGTQTTFIRYKRMNVPLVPLSEGVTPANSTIATETVVSALDQWGDVVTITDVAQLTTLHPLAQIAQQLLADNAQRVIDREVQIVMLSGTNVQYGDGSVTTRATITQSMTITDKIIHKATLTLENAGAPPRDGPGNMKEQAAAGPLSGSIRGSGNYVGVTGGEIVRDIETTAVASGMWTAYHQYQDKQDLYNGEVGTYLGVRWVGSNFLPKFTRLGNKTTAAALGADAGGITGLTTAMVDGTAAGIVSATAYKWKVTRKDLTRGFEEAISAVHTTAAGGAGDNDGISFTFPNVTSPTGGGYVYNLYFSDAGNTGTDAHLFLVAQNVAASGVYVVNALPTTGANPPPSNRVSGGDATDPDNIYPCWLLGQQWLAWVGLQDLQVLTTGGAPDKADPLGQRSTIGYKFFAKACILDQTRGLRLELPSTF
jgi:N4-gp56 family major capsid protein